MQEVIDEVLSGNTEQAVDTETQEGYDNESDILGALDNVPKRTAGIKYNNGNAITLTNREYAEVTSRISTNYHNANTQHEGIQFVDRSTDGKDAKMYMYLYRDHGFGSYEIIGRVDYARHGQLINYIREANNGGQQVNRTAEGISERLDRLQYLEKRADSGWGSDPYGRSNSGNEPQNQDGNRQWQDDNRRTGWTDYDGYDDRRSGINGSSEQTTPAANESVGAAPGWFDVNTRLQYEYGTIPEGESPVRTALLGLPSK